MPAPSGMLAAVMASNMIRATSGPREEVDEPGAALTAGLEGVVEDDRAGQGHGHAGPEGEPLILDDPPAGHQPASAWTWAPRAVTRNAITSASSWRIRFAITMTMKAKAKAWRMSRATSTASSCRAELGDGFTVRPFRRRRWRPGRRWPHPWPRRRSAGR